MGGPLVGVVVGSDSDLPVMEECLKQLDALGVPYEMRVLSAHRTPEAAARWAASARERGLKVIIAAASGAAHLAGTMAAWSTLPVIGVPLAATPLAGWDALLATVQMPPGVPVATVAVGSFGAVNAAVLSAQVLATADEALARRLEEHKRNLAARVAARDEAVRRTTGAS